jgi:hypothetical protein
MTRRFVLDSWCCMYAKWLLWQFGNILDKYLFKKREVTINI